MDNDFLYEMDELLNQGSFGEVIDRISSLDEDEMNIELHLMLAHALSQCARYHEALDTLRAIEDETAQDDMGYHLELAGALFGLHHYTSAIKEARHCLEIDESCVEPWLILCLVYQETGRDKEFEYASERARELDEDAWDNIFGDRSDELALYEAEDTEAVLDFISKHFGRPVEMLGLRDENGEKIVHPINCLLIPPSEELDFYKIVTVGIGAYKGIDSNTMEVNRVEMAVFLSPELTVDQVRNDYKWLVRIMRQFGEMIQLDNSWLAVGHTIAYGDVLDSRVGYNGAVFTNVFIDDPDSEKCVLHNGEEVEFLRLIPLFEEEMVYKIEKGYHALFQRLSDRLPQKMIDFVYNQRTNTCHENGGKRWAYPRSSIEELLDWKGADGCFATDRITVDGCKVGFMYREKPDNKFDSGWRFLAGDEDQEYMDDEKNMDIFKLNTICNYDPDIIEYLESPVGSKFYRDKRGRFRRVRN